MNLNIETKERALNMMFACQAKFGRRTERWSGTIVSFEKHGSHYEIQINSRSSITVVFGKTTRGGFACMPDFGAGCHWADLKERFCNTEQLTKVLGKDGVMCFGRPNSILDTRIINCGGINMREDDLKVYFITTGFIDLLQLALKLAGEIGFDKGEVIEAICKVADKFREYPPTKNRAGWFAKVFMEKLGEARADILRKNYLRNM